jgi:hypothetical protein
MMKRSPQLIARYHMPSRHYHSSNVRRRPKQHVMRNWSRLGAFDAMPIPWLITSENQMDARASLTPSIDRDRFEQEMLPKAAARNP